MERDLKILIDDVESLFKTAAGDDIDLLDGLFRIANGIQKILTLGGEEVVALLGFVELFQSLGIDGAQVVNLGT